MNVKIIIHSRITAELNLWSMPKKKTFFLQKDTKGSSCPPNNFTNPKKQFVWIIAKERERERERDRKKTFCKTMSKTLPKTNENKKWRKILVFSGRV